MSFELKRMLGAYLLGEPAEQGAEHWDRVPGCCDLRGVDSIVRPMFLYR